MTKVIFLLMVVDNCRSGGYKRSPRGRDADVETLNFKFTWLRVKCEIFKEGSDRNINKALRIRMRSITLYVSTHQSSQNFKMKKKKCRNFKFSVCTSTAFYHLCISAVDVFTLKSPYTYIILPIRKLL